MRNAPALHGRDHCPGGADPIPCLTNAANYARAECTSVPTIPATSGAIPITWDIHHNTNPDVFGTGSGPAILSGNKGIVIAESKVKFAGVGGKVAAVLVGFVIAAGEGGDGAWWWPGDDIINTDPLNAAQEYGTKDIAIGRWDGDGIGTIGVNCYNADGVGHAVTECILHVAFYPCENDFVQVYP